MELPSGFVGCKDLSTAPNSSSRFQRDRVACTLDIDCSCILKIIFHEPLIHVDLVWGTGDFQCSRVNELDQSDQDVYLLIGSVMDRKKFFLDCAMLLATTSRGQLLLVLLIFCTDLIGQDGPISSISFQWNWDGIARETMLAGLVKRHLWSPMVHGGPLKFCSNTSESQKFQKGWLLVCNICYSGLLYFVFLLALSMLHLRLTHLPSILMHILCLNRKALNPP